MHVCLNHRAVLVGAIVVGGDAARTIVHPLPHGGVTQIGQVIGLGTRGQGGVFDFHKVTNVHLGPQPGTGAQACERANQ